ncbi:MAG: peptidoglycan DD-metalloendopeptidase family protein [Candidatus Eremiobacteraeota bacterium]|nr:peptidoglycan DD-metalloendopeptidase family protein [Candidatus Eremiobacteraeota bacterium]
MTLRRIAATLLAVALLCAPALSRTSYDRQIEAHRQHAQQLQSQLNAKRHELHGAQVRVGNLKAQLSQTNAAIGSVNVRLDELSAQQHSTEKRLAWNTIQLNAAKATLKLHSDALKRRLVDIYQHGDLGYIDVLLSATSFSDFVERWDDLRLLIAANQRAIRARRTAEKKVASAEQELEATQAALQASAEAQRRAKNQLATLADERANLVAIADDQRRHVAGQVAEMESLSSGEEAQLEALILARQREIEAERLARQRAAGITGPVVTDSGGSLSWPVSGTITSPYGPRRNPFGGGMEIHQGLDIGASMGTTISAAAAGTIISAGWYGGYGNFILIDHGNGLSTGYGHCSQIFVSAGQEVQRGQAIGAVGSTGVSTGPHLHFEVRVNGKTVDPASRLR